MMKISTVLVARSIKDGLAGDRGSLKSSVASKENPFSGILKYVSSVYLSFLIFKFLKVYVSLSCTSSVQDP